MKKLTIADVKATEILSKEERKMVIGGEEGSQQTIGTAGGGQCNGVGTWTYPDRVSLDECKADVKKYCADGGRCTGVFYSVYL